MKTKTQIKSWLKEVKNSQAENEAKLNAATSNYEFELLHEEKLRLRNISDVLELVIA